MDPEFDAYLAIIGATCELIVVDGSPANLFEVNHRRWSKHLHVSVSLLTTTFVLGQNYSISPNALPRRRWSDPKTTLPHFRGTPRGTRDARYSIERQVAIGLALSPSAVVCSSGPAVTRATVCLRTSNS